ncbi:MAG: heme o synthase [Pyrobaculum sp.]
MHPYLELLKPRVIWLLILASVAGYVYSARAVDFEKLALLVLVGLLSTGGSAAFNHFWERDIDAFMARTAKRPLPRGSVPPSHALAYSLALSALGIAMGFALLGPLPGLFVALGWFFYVVVYTMWLKRRTWLNVLGGGFAGNAAFLSGYVLGRGAVDLPAVLMSFVIYLWIPPHIWALAYKYRDDYKKAGVPMFSTMVSQTTAIAAISILNIASAVYATALYLYFKGVDVGAVLVAAGAAAATAFSIKALVRRDDQAMWQIFKASSPVLTLFLMAVMLP